MSDQINNVELKLILRNTETASRDARAALEATDRLVNFIVARFGSIEDRITAVESRIGGVERRVGGLEIALDTIARSNHRIEQMLADITGRLPVP